MSTPTTSRQPDPGVLARELSYRLEHDVKDQPRIPGSHLSYSLPEEEVLARTDQVTPNVLPSSQAWKLYFTQEVAFDSYLSLQMYALTLGTGLLDATTYSAYRVFSTKMTGNLLLLAVDAIDRTSISTALEQNVATAIGAFIVGAVAFGHIGRLVGRRRRLYLLITNLLQTSLVFGATAIQHWGIQEEIGYNAVIKMFLLAFAMAGQVSLAIGVGLPELNTTMITSSLIQLCYDPRIFCLNNRPRTRRLAFITTMAAGHFAGAAASRSSTTLGLLLAACVKGVVTMSFLVNPGMVPVPTTDTEKNETHVDGAVTPVTQILWGD